MKKISLTEYLDFIRVGDYAEVWLVYLIAFSSHAVFSELSPASFLPILALTCACIAGNVFNDIHDIAIDQINKPTRLLPSGKLSLTAAHYHLWVFAGAAIILACFSSIWTLIIITSVLLAGLVYSHPRISWAKKHFFGTFVVMLSSVVAPYILAVLNLHTNFLLSDTLLLLSIAALSIARILLKDFEDEQGDKQHKKITPFLLLGRKKILIIFICCLVLSLSLLGSYLVVIGRPSLVAITCLLYTSMFIVRNTPIHFYYLERVVLVLLLVQLVK